MDSHSRDPRFCKLEQFLFGFRSEHLRWLHSANWVKVHPHWNVLLILRISSVCLRNIPQILFAEEAEKQNQALVNASCHGKCMLERLVFVCFRMQQCWIRWLGFPQLKISCCSVYLSVLHTLLSQTTGTASVFTIFSKTLPSKHLHLFVCKWS